MENSSVARRYAKAVSDIAVAEGRFDAVVEELSRAREALATPELARVLANPATTREDRRQIVASLVQPLALGPVIANTLRLLADRDRLTLLPQIERVCRQLADERAGRLRAKIVSAAPLDEKAAATLGSTLSRATGRNVVLERAVDPALLGGVVATVGGKVYDGSLATQLESLKRHLKA